MLLGQHACALECSPVTGIHAGHIGVLLPCPKYSNMLQMRIQRIIAERFLPILDDVFVQHKTHILRTTAISGGVTCIAGILGSKSVELKASGAPLHRHLTCRPASMHHLHVMVCCCHAFFHGNIQQSCGQEDLSSPRVFKTRFLHSSAFTADMPQHTEMLSCGSKAALCQGLFSRMQS